MLNSQTVALHEKKGWNANVPLCMSFDLCIESSNINAQDKWKYIGVSTIFSSEYYVQDFNII